MIQIIEQSHEEKVEMYMKCTKKELTEMLIESNRQLDTAIKNWNIPVVTISEAEYCDCPQPHIITTTNGGTKCSLCGKWLFKQY